MEKYINEYIRPRLQGDGGEITFVEEKGDEVTVLLQGECSKCLILDRCLKWIEERIAKELYGDIVYKCWKEKIRARLSSKYAFQLKLP